MNITQKIRLIDNAIDKVLDSLSEGIEIKEYWIDNIKVVKKSPLELVTELRKIKKALIADERAKTQPKVKQFVFDDRY